MKAVYQTQEGSSYVLRSVSKRLGFSTLAAYSFPLTLHVNQPDTTLYPDFWHVYKLNGQQPKIIPVMAYLNTSPSGVAPPGPTLLEIETPFYTAWSPSPPGNQSSLSLNAQSKMYSQTRLINNTSADQQRYVINYETFNFSDADFIDCTGGFQFIFTRFQRIAYTSPPGVFYNYNEFTLGIGNYLTSISFLYFEMVK